MGFSVTEFDSVDLKLGILRHEIKVKWAVRKREAVSDEGGSTRPDIRIIFPL